VSLSQFRWVALVPGAIALHLIPYLPNSAATCLVIPRLAALAIVYGVPFNYIPDQSAARLISKGYPLILHIIYNISHQN
jgi:hypothetical protein